MSEKEVNLDDGMDVSADDELDISEMDLMGQSTQDLPACEDCPYYQFCIRPPEVDEEEAKEIMQEAQQEGPEKAASVGVALQRAMTRLPACPRFIEKIKKDEELAREIKQLMKDKYGDT